MRFTVEHVRAPMRAAMTAAWGTSGTERELLLVTLTDQDGRSGCGEAAPLPGYGLATIAQARAGLEACRDVLQRTDAEDRAVVLAACAERTVVPEALAAIDLALWDLAGVRAQAPVWRLLGADGARPVALNATITAPDRAGAAAAAAHARAEGYRCVKLKVGTGDDAGRVAAVRAVLGPDVAIRLDANGAWDVAEALAALRVLAPAGIECCEEPVHGLDACESLGAQTDVALALDESAGEPGALDRRRATAVCLKLGRCGGITGLVASARRARRAGYEVYLASTLDGPLGIAAALHAAVAIGPDRPCGLATLGLFDPAPPQPAIVRGSASPPPGPGLGDGLRAFYGEGQLPGSAAGSS